MYSVPFLLWPSPRWAEHRDMNALRIAQGRPWSLTRLMHGWCDLAALHYSQCNASHSIFNPQFAAETRWLGSDRKGKLFSYEEIARQELAIKETRKNQSPALLSFAGPKALPEPKKLSDTNLVTNKTSVQ